MFQFCEARRRARVVARRGRGAGGGRAAAAAAGRNGKGQRRRAAGDECKRLMNANDLFRSGYMRWRLTE